MCAFLQFNKHCLRGSILVTSPRRKNTWPFILNSPPPLVFSLRHQADTHNRLLNTPAICWSSACAAALMPLTLVTHNGGCTPFIPAPTRPCTTTALLCCGLAPWAGCLLEPAPACVRSVVLLRVGPTSNCSRLYRLSVEGRPEGRAGVHDQRSCTQPLNKWSPC